ncbi:PREDICTED: uncharacterized protein LOC109211748 [Nicotiana attenuata]|uniref:uncharacterized protein LOC109211748 n=1 Tax=Nicotiana attenuata TaxID=49451 RepID=UPI0009059A3E|nr:PREDICTED: uncharacterized protein LOC109211748 [Nicotiana attenuata]
MSAEVAFATKTSQMRRPAFANAVGSSQMRKLPSRPGFANARFLRKCDGRICFQNLANAKIPEPEIKNYARTFRNQFKTHSSPWGTKPNMQTRNPCGEIEDKFRGLILVVDECIQQGGGAVFSSLEFKSWAQKASIEVVRLLLNQGLALRGHREDKSSLNKSNFLEILLCYAKRCDQIRDLVLKKAPKNDQLTSHKILNDIIIACKNETVKAIMDDLNGDFFALLVDESCDVSRKEQLAIVLRYVNRWEYVVEHFIGIVHVRNTSALCLKEEIVDYLAQYFLSLYYVCGQCYYGANNMQGDLRGLKTLI